ncbi:MAG: hypothetical protein RIM83_08940 [Allomuricauda sp.]
MLKNLFVYAFLLLLFSCSSESEIPSSENQITSFKIKNGNSNYEASITSNSISGALPKEFTLEEVDLEVEISKGASINPDPLTITSLIDPVTFTVTAQDGSVREYIVDVSIELSSESSITSVTIIYDYGTIPVYENGESIFSRRIPAFIQLDNVELDVQISSYATIDPLPEEVTDFSSPVIFTVTAENGNETSYQVSFETMDIDFEISCTESNASKWFGGDDRDDPDLDYGPFDRNVGTGQTLVLAEDLYPESFGVVFADGFISTQSEKYYDQELELRLDIRDGTGLILGTATGIIPSTYRGGWVYFDLSSLEVFLEANKSYVFTWYLLNGGEIGVNTSSMGYIGDSGEETCNAIGFSGQSNISKFTTLQMWNTWFEHQWHFNYSLSGKR